MNLIDKLDDFIRKYYKNKMLKGLLIAAAILLLFMLFLLVVEFLGQFGTALRTTMYFSYICVSVSVLVYYVLIPFLKLNKIGKRLTYEQAALLIGKHFPDINDKLINTLQLQESLKHSPDQVLLLATINQRSEKLSPFPFVNVINYKANRKYALYALLPLFVFLGILLISPSIITESSIRLLNHNVAYKPKAPFTFHIRKPLSVIEGNDYELIAEVKGDFLPNEVEIYYNNQVLSMEKRSKNVFAFWFRNLTVAKDFQFLTGKYTSDPYHLNVIPKPSVDQFSVRLQYPTYLHKQAQTITNSGDIQAPEGTIITWKIKAQKADKIQIAYADKLQNAIQAPNTKVFVSGTTAKQSMPYWILSANRYLPQPDSMQFQIAVTPDAYPAINVEATTDSLMPDFRYFSGNITDDYGFTKLVFKTQILDEQAKVIQQNVQNLSLNGKTAQRFYHFIALSSFKLQPGQSLQYYFEVWDNDGVNGSKSAKSTLMQWKLPTEAEMEQQQENNAEQVKNNIENAISDAEKLQQEAEKLKRKIAGQKEMNWDDKKAIENLLKKQQQLTQTLEKANEKFKLNNEQKKQFSQQEEQILDMQKQIQDMMEKLLNDDLKKMIDELRKMMEDFEKKNPKAALDEMKLDNKEVEKELNRMLSFFKQMELEEKLKKSTDKLEQLAEKQEKESQETADKKQNNEQQLKDQEALNKQFEALKKELNEIEKDNKNLEEPSDALKQLDEGAEDVKKDQQEATQSLEKQNKSGAAKNQKNAAQDMKKMAQKLKDKASDSQMESMEEDIQALRMLLENLLKFSIQQEALIKQLNDNSNYSPVYVQIAQEQYKLKDQAKLIEDSLYALSKRVQQISSFINKEVGNMNSNLNKAVTALGNRNTPDAKVRQQYVMTAANNLALMLSEILQQMQQQMMQMQDQKKKTGSCKKPGSSSSSGKQPKLGKMNELQKQLNQQMKQAKDAMEKNGMPNKKGQRGNNGMSSQFAQMAAQQEALRRELQKLSQEMNKQGNGLNGQLEQIQKEMEKTEKDLVNKNISTQTLQRQQEILTRMLESEKAQKEREQDKERESNTAKNTQNKVPQGFDAYKREKDKEIELLKQRTSELNPFYKKKADAYFMNLNR